MGQKIDNNRLKVFFLNNVGINTPNIFINVCTKFSDVPYEVTVYTSDVMGAGSSAHVYIVLYGSDGCTEEVMLADTSKKQKDSFKRGSTDQFVKEVGTCIFV